MMEKLSIRYTRVGVDMDISILYILYYIDENTIYIYTYNLTWNKTQHHISTCCIWTWIQLTVETFARTFFLSGEMAKNVSLFYLYKADWLDFCLPHFGWLWIISTFQWPNFFLLIVLAKGPFVLGDLDMTSLYPQCDFGFVQWFQGSFLLYFWSTHGVSFPLPAIATLPIPFV